MLRIYWIDELPSAQENAAKSSYDQPGPKARVYEIHSLKPVLEISRKFFIDPAQDGDARGIVLLLNGAVHVNNTKWPLWQLTANFVEHIPLQPLRTHNGCCTPFESTSAPKSIDSNFKTAPQRNKARIFITITLIIHFHFIFLFLVWDLARVLFCFFFFSRQRGTLRRWNDRIVA